MDVLWDITEDWGINIYIYRYVDVLWDITEDWGIHTVSCCRCCVRFEKKKKSFSAESHHKDHQFCRGKRHVVTVSLDGFKGKSRGNQGFYMFLPLDMVVSCKFFPINQNQ